MFVRSVHPHARIVAIDAAAARAMPGVLAVLTGADAEADGLGGLPWEVRPPLPKGADETALPPMGSPDVAMPQPVIARDIVALCRRDRRAGRRRDQGRRARRSGADRDRLRAPACRDSDRGSAQPGAAEVWPQFPDNVCFDFKKGDQRRGRSGLRQGPSRHAARPRQYAALASPLETRGYIGAYDGATGRYTLYASAGKPNPIKRSLARDVFGIPPDDIRVVTRDVGGGFGTKNVAYAEEALVLWASRRLGRPVKWIADRSESFISDVQGRDQVNRCELALDARGHFLALRLSTIANLGAYLGPRGVIPLISGTKLLASVYRLPAAYYELKAVFTNTVPTCPYRGAGHPEVIFQIERLVDTAARELGIDPAELRRRNLIPAHAMPHQTVADVVYDCGDFERNMTDALRWRTGKALPARRKAAARRGRLRGLGSRIALRREVSVPGQKAWVDVDADGFVTVRMGTQSSGQSHATVYSQIVAGMLGIPLHEIKVIQGDTDIVPGGDGTGGCRSLVIDGSALDRTMHVLIEKAKRIAAGALEAAVDDIEFSGGDFRVVGTDRAISFREVARAW